MAHKTVSEDDLLDKALTLFRASGYEGVSLSELSKATGLEKASLYFRYPGGKEEIALAVLLRVVNWFEQNVFAPLRTDLAPRKRVALVAEQLRVFYDDGRKSCLNDVLSLPGTGEKIETCIKVAMQAWMKAFTEIARESGLSAGVARLRAEEAIVRIEGSLVVARALGDFAPFDRTIKLLPELLTTA
jgi:TetR/AcrR family transcriptional repressor of lmrAB and yxaGH operons